MSLIIPIITAEELATTHTFAVLLSAGVGSRLAPTAPLSVGVGSRLDPAPVLASADITAGEGTVVIVDAISSILDAAR